VNWRCDTIGDRGSYCGLRKVVKCCFVERNKAKEDQCVRMLLINRQTQVVLFGSAVCAVKLVLIPQSSLRIEMGVRDSSRPCQFEQGNRPLKIVEAQRKSRSNTGQVMRSKVGRYGMVWYGMGKDFKESIIRKSNEGEATAKRERERECVRACVWCVHSTAATKVPVLSQGARLGCQDDRGGEDAMGPVASSTKRD